MREEVHFHQKVVGNLNLGCLSGFTDGTVIFAFTVIFRTGTVFKKQYQ